MPANLTPQYKEAEERYRAAETTAEKLAALDEMMAIIPKHKGTEHMRADIKRRISKLKEQDGKKGGHGRRDEGHSVDREGAGQVVLVGPPNSGKSTLLSRITNALPDVGTYPFTTHRPLPGMMEYEDVKVQIVDMPPISEQNIEPWIPAIARNADALVLVLDMGDGAVLDGLEETLGILERYRVKPYDWRGEAPEDETGLLTMKKAIFAANKMDLPDASGNMEVVRELWGEMFPISAQTGDGLEGLRNDTYAMLDVVRVYTKAPGKQADMEMPYVIPRGSTVEDVAAIIHKDFAEKLRFAKIWGGVKFDGQMVSRQHVLEDRDVIEFHV